MLTAALDALTTPWTHGNTGPHTDRTADLGADHGADTDTRSPAQRRYDAIVEIGRRQLHHPTTSGDGGKAQIRVTIPCTR